MDLPSALVSKIAESLDYKDFSKFSRSNKTIKGDLKDNWERMAERDLGVSREAFRKEVKRTNRSPSETYNRIYAEQKDLVRNRIISVDSWIGRDDPCEPCDAHQVYRF